MEPGLDPPMKLEVLVTQSYLTLCDPMDCSPPGSAVHGILQARILEWVAISSSRGSSPPRDQTQVSYIAGRFFTIWATRGAPEPPILSDKLFQKHQDTVHAIQLEKMRDVDIEIISVVMLRSTSTILFLKRIHELFLIIWSSN